jgi:hypothetical protein
MLLSLVRGLIRWSLRRLFSGGRATRRVLVSGRRPTGVEEHVQMDIGVPQELGRPCRFHGRNVRLEIPDDQLQVRRLACGGDGSHEINRMLAWYRRAKETK